MIGSLLLAISLNERNYYFINTFFYLLRNNGYEKFSRFVSNLSRTVINYSLSVFNLNTSSLNYFL